MVAATTPLYVVVPTVRGRSSLSETLASLARCAKPACFAGTVVVENGPPGNAEALAAPFREQLRLQYSHVPVPNKSLALNHVVQQLAGSLLFLTDDDVEVGHHTLLAYADAADRFRSRCFFGGPATPRYEKQPPVWLQPYLPPSAVGWSLEGGEQVVTRPLFIGFNWAVYADDVIAAGGFDANRGPGSPSGSVGQEREMQCRLLTLGWSGRYLPTATVTHLVPERNCSPSWALHRAFRNGIQAGLEADAATPWFLGYPRWALRDLAVTVVRLTFRLGSRVARYPHLHQIYYQLGYLKGAVIRRRAANVHADRAFGESHAVPSRSSTFRGPGE